MTSTEKTFRRFTERNSHEGETWNFWLQVQGNEAELEKFAQALDEMYEGAPEYMRSFVLSEEILPEHDVNVLADNAHEGYMADHQVLEGVFTCPELGEDADTIYKGEIARSFKIAKEDQGDDLKILIESSARTFVLFTEDNDHEAENWNYWLELHNNEDELSKFAEMLRAAEAKAKEETDGKYHTFPYDFHPERVEYEAIVDKLVEYGESGYAAQHQKIEGVFTCPEALTNDCEDLYKGGIKDFFAKGDVA